MKKIISSKLKENLFEKRKYYRRRILYSCFFNIKNPKFLIKNFNSILKYKTVLKEKKIHSPIKGFIKENLFIKKNKNQKLNVLVKSTLTDSVHFGLSQFRLTKEKIKRSNIKILRKDFIFDKFQLIKSLIMGSDLVLLINNLTSKKRTSNLVKFSKFLGLLVLLESKCIDSKSTSKPKNVLLGINSRNLSDFKLEKVRVLEKINNKNVVYESGILNLNKLIKVRNIGFKGCLIGEGLQNRYFYINRN
ncbi:hypothetical protein ACWNYH_00210 [Candidatus Vidania fulgoroideorum]